MHATDDDRKREKFKLSIELKVFTTRGFQAEINMWARLKVPVKLHVYEQKGLVMKCIVICRSLKKGWLHLSKSAHISSKVVRIKTTRNQLNEWGWMARSEVDLVKTRLHAVQTIDGLSELSEWERALYKYMYAATQFPAQLTDRSWSQEVRVA